jgi:hypothetical protein
MAATICPVTYDEPLIVCGAPVLGSFNTRRAAE